MANSKQVFMGKTPTIYNKTMTSANTEYSQTLPEGTKKVLIKERSGAALVKLAYVETESATKFITIPIGASKYIEGIWLSDTTLYFQSTSAGKVLEIEVWQ